MDILLEMYGNPTVYSSTGELKIYSQYWQQSIEHLLKPIRYLPRRADEFSDNF